MARESDTTEPQDGATAVRIFGRTYHLRGGGDPDYLRSLADRVDTKMNEVAGATGTADTLRLAILAALNLADEAARGAAPHGEEIDRRIDALIRDLDVALAD